MASSRYFLGLSILLVSIIGYPILQSASGQDIPDIPDFSDFDIPEIPSQEEIEKMIQQQEIKGTYENKEHGVKVTIPDGWSGMASDFKDPNSGDWISGFSAMEGGLNANMNSMQQGVFSVMILSIIDKTEDKEPPEVAPPTDDFDFDCKEISGEIIKINGKDVMKGEAECSGDDVTMKARSYHYATAEKYIMYAFASSPASDFEKNIQKFEDSNNSISISNQVDIDYMIPEEFENGFGSSSSIGVTGGEKDSEFDVPPWVKNNAAWWADGTIGDNEFIQAIQFLIKEGIMVIPETAQAGDSDSSEGIPPWIKANAEWWSQGLITDNDFVKGIQYLVENGIIIV